jgi:autotransporter-associated beta strand protein
VIILRHQRHSKALLIAHAAAASLFAWNLSNKCAHATTYYVSPTGSDSNTGASPLTPWQSVTKVDSTNFNPGDQVLFQTGGNWYGSLNATSSGSASQPIVYGSYGSGADPTFWGSDIVPGSSFQPVSGTTYTYSTSTPVTSFFVNDQFAHSAVLVSGQTTDAGNISYVQNNTNSWYYDATTKQLYANPGSSISPGNGNTYSVAVRANAINSNQQSNVTFQNLETNETAAYNGGYGFYVWNGSNVTVQNCIALNGGKHNVAVIDANATIGGTTASGVMPDQGTGGATAFVSYSDLNHTGNSSVYNNDTVINYPNEPAFIDHADTAAALVSIQLNNFTTTSPVSIGLGGSDHVAVNGGIFINTSLNAAGNATVNGARITGGNGYLGMTGTNNLVENTLIQGANPSVSNPYFAAVVDQGTNDILRNSTIVMDPSTPFYYPDIALVDANSNFEAVGNIIDGPSKLLEAYYQVGSGGFSQPNNFRLAYNLYQSGPYQFADVFGPSDATLAQMQAAGLDVGSIVGAPQFVNTATGSYALLPTSAGYLTVPLNGMTQGDLFDILGQPRPQSGFDNAGAYTAVNLTWNNGPGGGNGTSWDTTSANWSIASTADNYTDGANVTFNDANNGHYLVTLNAQISPASVTFNSAGTYTLSGSGGIAGAGSLTKSGTGALYLNVADSFTGGTTVNAGSAIVGVTGALGTGPVKINGGSLLLASGTGVAQMTSLVISGNGTLDVNNNVVLISYSGASPIASIATYLASGYNGGHWNGLGIISTAAQSNSNYGLGYADAADPGNPAGLASGTIEIKYTLLGDADLNGVVNGIDFGILASNFNKGVSRWDQGDFNYDNVVNGIDFGSLAANFNKGDAGGASTDWAAVEAFAAANGLVDDLPEPGRGLAIAATAAGMLLRRRKRANIVLR